MFSLEGTALYKGSGPLYHQKPMERNELSFYKAEDLGDSRKGEYMKTKITTATIIIMTIVLSMTLTAFGAWEGEGLYSLSPKCAPGMSLDTSGVSHANGANLQIWKDKSLYSNGKNQRFYIIHMGGAYYTLIAEHSGKALDVKNGSKKSGANVWQYEYNLTNAQLWKMVSAGNGYHYLIPKLNGNLCLDVSGAGRSNGTNVQVWQRNYTSAQQFRLQLLNYYGYDSMYGSSFSRLHPLSLTPTKLTIKNDTGKQSSVTIRLFGGDERVLAWKASAKVNIKIVSKSKGSLNKIIKEKTYSDSVISIDIPKQYDCYDVYVSRYYYGSGIWNTMRQGNDGWNAMRFQLQSGNGRIISYR